jgi:2-alkyl-3-oxoalkanoate reductase
MTSSFAAPGSAVVVVTGANGFVGARVCAAVVKRGGTVRAVVRRAGTAPVLDKLSEHVGDFADPAFAATVVEGADAVVTTVHPMGSDRATQQRVAVEGTSLLARAARDAGVARLVHVSTCAVYDRRPGTGDVDESSALVGHDSDDYAVTKRDTDAALAEVHGITRVLVRPPAILGAGKTSVWNTLRPAGIRDDEQQRRANPARTFAWVHVDDLASLMADIATGHVAEAADVSTGPIAGGCTVVNVAGGPATARDYVGTVSQALGLEPVWDDDLPAWTGQILADRARAGVGPPPSRSTRRWPSWTTSSGAAQSRDAGGDGPGPDEQPEREQELAEEGEGADGGPGTL